MKIKRKNINNIIDKVVENKINESDAIFDVVDDLYVKSLNLLNYIVSNLDNNEITLLKKYIDKEVTEEILFKLNEIVGGNLNINNSENKYCANNEEIIKQIILTSRAINDINTLSKHGIVEEEDLF